MLVGIGGIYHFDHQLILKLFRINIRVVAHYENKRGERGRRVRLSERRIPWREIGDGHNKCGDGQECEQAKE